MARCDTGDADLGWKVGVKNCVRKKFLEGNGIHPGIETGGFHRRQEYGMNETTDKQERNENGLRDWN